MTKSDRYSRVDIIQTVVSIATLVCLFVVASSVERKSHERDIAGRENLKQQINQVYQVLQLVISRTESCAVETDRNGNVLWMNSLAKQTLNLQHGQNVTSSMTPHGAQVHNAKFHEAMQSDEITRKPLATIKECIAISKDGREINVSVETWRTPNGAMAFVTEIPEQKSHVSTTSVDRSQ